MFLIPYSTDAPLYHWPVATAGIIVANIVIYFATTFQVALGNVEIEQIEWLFIQFNQINPIQWLTGSFMHGGFGHLLGNMLFLFCFGLVVEGKIGSAPFVGIYLASCLVIGAVAQIPMFLLSGDGAALGASAVISTLMVIALVWAPENEISFAYWFMIVFFGTIDVRIIVVSAFFIAMDLWELIWSGFTMSGAMGHTIGAMLGFPIAVYCLREGRVDCEGWDLISRNEWLQEYPLLYGRQQRKKDADKTAEVEDPVATALAVTGGDQSLSQRIGFASSSHRTVQPNKKSKTKATPSGPQLKRKKRANKVVISDSVKRIEQAQAHPELNRMSFVLRNSLQSGNLVAAQQSFQKIDSMKIGIGLGDQTLMDYANALGHAKQWVNAIRPLALLIEREGTLADDACLRLAKIQLNVLKRPDQVELTLAKIVAPEGVVLSEAKRQRLTKRDELLAAARQRS